MTEFSEFIRTLDAEERKKQISRLRLNAFLAGYLAGCIGCLIILTIIFGVIRP